MLEYCLFIACGQLAVRINRRGVFHLFPVVGDLEVSRTHGRLVQGHEYEPAPGRYPDLDRAERRQVGTGVNVYGLKLPDFVTPGIKHVLTTPFPDAGNLEHEGCLLMQRRTGPPALPGVGVLFVAHGPDIVTVTATGGRDAASGRDAARVTSSSSPRTAAHPAAT